VDVDPVARSHREAMKTLFCMECAGCGAVRGWGGAAPCDAALAPGFIHPPCPSACAGLDVNGGGNAGLDAGAGGEGPAGCAGAAP
jgi:hypothetical protein